MSEKLNKKSIIAIAMIIILTAVAIIGTIVFLNDRGTSEAAGEVLKNAEEQYLGQEQNELNSEMKKQTENENNQGEGDIVENNVSEQAEDGTENQGQINTDNREEIQNNEIEESNQTQNTGTTANNQNAGIDEIQETTITRVEEIGERKVADDRNLGWTAIAINAEMASAKINAEKSDIEVHKYASTEIGNGQVMQNEEITYTIHVKNNSKEKLNNIEITDKIPEKTTYVETDDNAQKIKDKNGNVIGLKWYVNIDSNEVVGIQFKVKVNENESGTIVNIAIANGENSEEVKTVIIEQEDIEVPPVAEEPELINVSGTKIWEDEDNRDGIRPDNITVKLVSSDKNDNEEKIITIGKKQDDTYDWSYKFENLPKYDSEGKIIVYTVTEIGINKNAYQVSYSNPQKDDNGNIVIDITNKHEIEKITLRGEKFWSDDSNRDGKRPESIEVQLYIGEIAGEKKTVTPDENRIWKYEFTDLPKYESKRPGEEIKYSVKEVTVPEGYTSSYEDVTTDVETGDIIADITNTHEIETVTVKGEKKWEDSWEDTDNAYGVRPENITVVLNKKVGKNGEINPVSGKEVKITPDENGIWKYEFTNLPKYENEEIIEYTVTEKKVANYTASYENKISENENEIICNITNTITPSTTPTLVDVIKNGIKQRDIPVDVVFVVDRSASMVNNSKNGITRAENMISALNDCMQTVLEANPDNRVAVAAFSNDAEVILQLGHYAKPSNEYFTYNKNYTNNFRCNVLGGNSTSFSGGTYTQLGIRKGAEELINEIGNNDKNRTPIVILITDGLPTYYAHSLTPTVSDRLGDSNCEKPEEGAYTILTAKYYKSQLATKYGKNTIFLTVGIDLTNNQYATTILNPTESNINACKDSTEFLSDSYGRYPIDQNATQEEKESGLDDKFYAARNLYLALVGQTFETLQLKSDKYNYSLATGRAINPEDLTSVGAATNNLKSYSYATKTLSETNSTQLKQDIKKLLTDSYPSSDEVEASNEKADLPDIDTSKKFEIVAKQNTTVKVEYKGENAFANALNNRVVVEETDGNYYINLKHPKFYNCTEISIQYTSKN